MFFQEDEVKCTELLGWFTREDKLCNESITFYDLQPGDILLTLSTHSFGWRHGHAAIVLQDSLTTIESLQLGINSSIQSVEHWKEYSNVAVLRVKNKTSTERQAVADFAAEKLVDKPYSLFAGLGVNKAPKIDTDNLSMYCSYLVWYAWQHFGVDLDADNGRIVTTYDILQSDKVEIVQLNGLNPTDFIITE